MKRRLEIIGNVLVVITIVTAMIGFSAIPLRYFNVITATEGIYMFGVCMIVMMICFGLALAIGEKICELIGKEHVE